MHIIAPGTYFLFQLNDSENIGLNRTDSIKREHAKQEDTIAMSATEEVYSKFKYTSYEFLCWII